MIYSWLKSVGEGMGWSRYLKCKKIPRSDPDPGQEGERFP
jgi:hypothetical protein